MTDAAHLPEQCPHCDAMARQLEELTVMVSDYERDLRGKRATIRHLEAELAEQRRTHKKAPEAREVFEFWKQACRPRAREFSGKRLANTLARLTAGYEVEDLQKAILGAKVGATTGTNGERYDDLELICRDPKITDSFIARYEAWEQRQDLGKRARPEGLEDRPDADPLPPRQKLEEWALELQRRPLMLARLQELKGWTSEALDALMVGWDGERLTLPIHDRDGILVNVARYLPGGKPKMLAAKGRPRDLFPAVESAESAVWLVEGEGDALSARSHGLRAVGVPGAAFIAHLDPERFAGRDVTICFDCDEPGRKAASDAYHRLHDAGVSVGIVDLDPARDDGFDLSDFLLAGGNPYDAVAVSARPKVTPLPRQPRLHLVHGARRNPDPILGVLDALERHGCAWKVSGRDQWMSQCPAHADRTPSLSLRQEDGRVLVRCHAGCDTSEVIATLGIDWGALFEEARHE